jgi:hypothetical protein
MKSLVWVAAFAVALSALWSYHRYAVESNYEYGYEVGGDYERAIEDRCRREIGDSYDKMVFCIEGYYGTEEAEKMVPYHRDLRFFQVKNWFWSIGWLLRGEQ